MKRRFTVGSVTGYTIGPRLSAGRRRASRWYVHDRAYCFQVVCEFSGLDAEKQARKRARELNK